MDEVLVSGPETQGRKEVGCLPPTSFVPILLAIIASLKSSSPEEVIASHNKHCQEQV